MLFAEFAIIDFVFMALIVGVVTSTTVSAILGKYRKGDNLRMWRIEAKLDASMKYQGIDFVATKEDE